MNPRVHEPTDACYPVHCFEHMVDEDYPGYLRCGECFHVYRSAGELRRAYCREYWKISRIYGDSLLARFWRVLTIRATDIYFCQHCIHDF